jgi:hypothetical protein
MFHDSGLYDYEASPTVAADTGKPLNFMTWASRGGALSNGRSTG